MSSVNVYIRINPYPAHNIVSVCALYLRSISSTKPSRLGNYIVVKYSLDYKPTEEAIMKSEHTIGIFVVAIVATAFGVLTVISGGSVLFIEEKAQAAGHYVPFVVWFNFLAGFAYVIAGLGIGFRQRWAVWMSASIAMLTVLILGLLGLHIMNGEEYELRTVIALIFRATVWASLTLFSYRRLS